MIKEDLVKINHILQESPIILFVFFNDMIYDMANLFKFVKNNSTYCYKVWLITVKLKKVSF